MSQRYLITGGAGNLACQLTRLLAERKAEVLLWDIADRPQGPIVGNCSYVQGDLRSLDSLRTSFRRFSPDVIIHFASLLSCSSEERRTLAWEVNMDGVFGLLELAVEFGVQRFFFPSSVASFGSPLPTPVPEDFPQWPTGLYGVTKVATERLGYYYYQKHGLDFRCLRVPIVVSSAAHTGATSSYASLAFMEACRKREFTFRVRQQTRPALVYVEDLLRGILKLLDTPEESLTRRSYNLQALSPTSAEIAEAIVDRIPEAKMRFDPDTEITSLIDSWPTEFVDISSRQDWGWDPSFDLPAMADHFIAALQSRQKF